MDFEILPQTGEFWWGRGCRRCCDFWVLGLNENRRHPWTLDFWTGPQPIKLRGFTTYQQGFSPMIEMLVLRPPFKTHLIFLGHDSSVLSFYMLNSSHAIIYSMDCLDT